MRSFSAEQFKEEKINEKIEEFIAAEQKAQAEEKKPKKNKTGIAGNITDRTGGEQSWKLEMLKTIIEKTLGRNMDAITEKTTFVDDLGVDSLDFFQILIDLEETFDVRIAPEEAEEIVTVGDAVETLRRVTKGRRNGK